VEAIKGRITLIDTVGHQVKLRRVGRNRVGLCPFHREKTPSFTLIGPELERFHCFGCGAHGDVLDFEARMRGATLNGAFLSQIAGELGIERGAETPAERIARRERQQQEKQLAEEAALFWLHARLSLTRTWRDLRRAERALTESSRTLVETNSAMDVEFAAFKASATAMGELDRLLEALDCLEQNDTRLASERILLGLVISGAVEFAEMAIELGALDFFSEGHRLTFEAIAALAARGEEVDRATVARELLKGVDLRQAGPFVRGEQQPDGRDVFRSVLFEFLLGLDDDLPANPDEWKWRARLVKQRRKATVDLYLSFAKALPKLRPAIRKQIEIDVLDAALVVGMLAAADSVGAPRVVGKVA
jgi:hypothetical protein